MPCWATRLWLATVTNSTPRRASVGCEFGMASASPHCRTRMSRGQHRGHRPVAARRAGCPPAPGFRRRSGRSCARLHLRPCAATGHRELTALVNLCTIETLLPGAHGLTYVDADGTVKPTFGYATDEAEKVVLAATPIHPSARTHQEQQVEIPGAAAQARPQPSDASTAVLAAQTITQRIIRGTCA